MAKLYAGIIDDAETLVQDSGKDPSSPGAQTVFATNEVESLLPAALAKISQYKPWQIKTTKSTVASTRDITLTTGDKWRLLGIEKLEYLTGKDPQRFRNYSRFGDVVSVKIDSKPPAVADIYFFWNKVHLLQKALGANSEAGALKVDEEEGDVSLALDGLGAGYIDEMTTLAIVGDSTVYYVTARATITSNEATVSIWPPLTADADADAVVSITLTGSTLDSPLEDYLARYLAATLAISKATKSYAQVNAAITTVANAATAIAAIAARITAASASVTTAKTKAVKAATAIADANTEFDKIVAATVGPTVLATSALASGLSLVNTIPIGGGAAEYMGQAASQIGLAQGHALAGQTYLQEASAYHANAASYYNSAATELRASSEKANEAVANLRLVATRLQVSRGGLNYERWGRTELARVEADMRAYGGFPSSIRYPRD